MKKTLSKYVCTECGAVSPSWLGKCPICGKFGTLVEEVEEIAKDNETSFNNVIISMIEACLEYDVDEKDHK